jgi:hypothetical protein
MKSTLFAAALLALAATASAQVNVTGSKTTGIDDQNGSGLDVFTFADGSFNPALGTVDVTSYSFLAGVNNDHNGDLLTGTADFTLSAFGITSTVVLPYTFTVANNDDSIAFDSVTKFYTIGGQTYAFKTDAFSLTNGGGLEQGELTATISAVPETGNMALLLAGLGMVGIVSRRRRA